MQLQYGAILGLCLTSALWLRCVSAGPVASNEGNIRPLTCKSKTSNESGTCMFALQCMELNGVSLGACADRYYIGSCCQVNKRRSFHADPARRNSVGGQQSSHQQYLFQ